MTITEQLKDMSDEELAKLNNPTKSDSTWITLASEERASRRMMHQHDLDMKLMKESIIEQYELSAELMRKQIGAMKFAAILSGIFGVGGAILGALLTK
jgi:hypothetical protein